MKLSHAHTEIETQDPICMEEIAVGGKVVMLPCSPITRINLLITRRIEREKKNE